jgi:hypothetical protein
MTADMEADVTTYSATYAELAARLGIAVASAKTLVRRHRWQKIKGNDGCVRVLVPLDYFKDDSRHDSSHVSSHESSHVSPHESVTDSRQSAPGTVEAIAALERHVARLEADMAAAAAALMSARTEADEMKAKARTEAVTSAAMKATLEAVTAERDRLLIPWWSRWRVAAGRSGQ